MARAKKTSKTAIPLEGCTIALSGKVKGKTAKIFAEEVESAGAKFSASVTLATTHLVVDFDPEAGENMGISTKTQRADEIGVPIVRYTWVTESIAAGAQQDAEKHKVVGLGNKDDDSSDGATARKSRKRSKADDSADAQDDDQEVEKRPKRARTAKAKAEADAALQDAKNATFSVTPQDAAQKQTKTKARGKAKKNDTKTDDKADGDDDAGKNEEEEEPKLKTIVRKGAAPVDECSGLSQSHHVATTDSTVWDCTLNQTNVGSNANKFYIMQVLEGDQGSGCVLFFRWGRVGENGQKKLQDFPSVYTAADAFRKQFRSKTGCAWEYRGQTEPQAGKYVYLEREHADEDKPSEPDDSPGKGKEKATDPEKLPTKLAQPVFDVAKLIFSNRLRDAALAEMKYDARKLPLGKLSKAAIDAGYRKLSEIDRLLRETGMQHSNDPRLAALTNAYYSLIPHVFGRDKPPIINTVGQVQNEGDIVGALKDMTASLSYTKRAEEAQNPMDSAVERLGLSKFEPVAKNTAEYKALEKYCLDTRGGTHTHFSYSVVDIFRVERPGEEEAFKPWLDIKPDNRELLWHGSRITNFGGILGQGLRIAPPEAPISGHMFAKGVYLANMASKSIQYCYSSASEGNGILLLCEAQLGTSLKLLNADYYADQHAKEQNCHSAHGQGFNAPSTTVDCGSALKRKDMAGVRMPQGPITQNNTNGSLYYDEKIVYDTSQLRFRYMFRINVK